jgi:flagellar FliL protein
MPAEDNEVAQEKNEKTQKGGGINLVGLLINVSISAALVVVLFFILNNVLGSNVPGTQDTPTGTAAPVEIRVRFIPEGAQRTFMLKGGRDVIVIDMLSFVVGSDAIRSEISNRSDQILSALQDLFIQKEGAELSNPAGLELLKRQVRDMVNQITGHVGERAKFGVIEVFTYIRAITSVQ